MNKSHNYWHTMALKLCYASKIFIFIYSYNIFNFQKFIPFSFRVMETEKHMNIMIIII